MLKLEKTSPDRQVSVILRDKENLFTHSFIVAFSWAAGFHLLLLILFQVTPIKLRFSETLFPPISVETDTVSNDAIVLAEMALVPLVASDLPPFTSSTPTLTEHPYYLSLHHIEYLKETPRTNNPFEQIEKEIYHPRFTPLAKGILPPISVIVSGQLAEHPLILDGLTNKTVPVVPNSSLSAGKELRVIYQVYVEGKSGDIFWYEPKQVTHIASLDRFAETVLHDMRFAEDKASFVTAGEVELHFNLETAITNAPQMQNFDSESLLMGGDHSQKVKAPSIKSDYGSKDCVCGAFAIAVSRFTVGNP